jgi:dTDP-4-amino-4,6-dideoxygalactose transaminase
VTAPIPFLDLAGLHAAIRPEIDRAIAATIDSSSFVGPCHEFEDRFASAHGVAHAAGCGSGTDALVLALTALGLGPGDEVAVPALTFVATAEAVLLVGATPVIVDVAPDDLLLTAAAVEAARTPAMRAVIPVHLYGRMVAPADLQAMRAAGLYVIEDAAQAHLARREGVGVGTISHCATFSFHPGKNLGALGDGGAVLTTDGSLADEVRARRDHGRRPIRPGTTDGKGEHDRLGRCSRLDGVQAAVLLAKLAHLPEWTAARRANADEYRTRLGDGVVPYDEGAVHHLLVARAADRARLTAALRREGIGWGVHYAKALTEHPSLAPWRRACPIAEQAAREVVSLPVGPTVTADDVARVAAVVEPWLAVREQIAILST